MDQFELSDNPTTNPKPPNTFRLHSLRSQLSYVLQENDTLKDEVKSLNHSLRYSKSALQDLSTSMSSIAIDNLNSEIQHLQQELSEAKEQRDTAIKEVLLLKQVCYFYKEKDQQEEREIANKLFMLSEQLKKKDFLISQLNQTVERLKEDKRSQGLQIVDKYVLDANEWNLKFQEEIGKKDIVIKQLQEENAKMQDKLNQMDLQVKLTLIEAKKQLEITELWKQQNVQQNKKQRQTDVDKQISKIVEEKNKEMLKQKSEYEQRLAQAQQQSKQISVTQNKRPTDVKQPEKQTTNAVQQQQRDQAVMSINEISSQSEKKQSTQQYIQSSENQLNPQITQQAQETQENLFSTGSIALPPFTPKVDDLMTHQKHKKSIPELDFTRLLNNSNNRSKSQPPQIQDISDHKPETTVYKPHSQQLPTIQVDEILDPPKDNQAVDRPFKMLSKFQIANNKTPQYKPGQNLMFQDSQLSHNYNQSMKLPGNNTNSISESQSMPQFQVQGNLMPSDSESELELQSKQTKGKKPQSKLDELLSFQYDEDDLPSKFGASNQKKDSLEFETEIVKPQQHMNKEVIKTQSSKHLEQQQQNYAIVNGRKVVVLESVPSRRAEHFKNQSIDGLNEGMEEELITHQQEEEIIIVEEEEEEDDSPIQRQQLQPQKNMIVDQTYKQSQLLIQAVENEDQEIIIVEEEEEEEDSINNRSSHQFRMDHTSLFPQLAKAEQETHEEIIVEEEEEEELEEEQAKRIQPAIKMQSLVIDEGPMVKKSVPQTPNNQYLQQESNQTNLQQQNRVVSFVDNPQTEEEIIVEEEEEEEVNETETDLQQPGNRLQIMQQQQRHIKQQSYVNGLDKQQEPEEEILIVEEEEEEDDEEQEEEIKQIAEKQKSFVQKNTFVKQQEQLDQMQATEEILIEEEEEEETDHEHEQIIKEAQKQVAEVKKTGNFINNQETEEQEEIIIVEEEEEEEDDDDN